MSAAREALRELLAVMNEDKDGGWFICAEAAETIEAAHKAAEAEPEPQAASLASRYRVESYADDPGRFYVYEFTPDGYEVIHAENLPSLEAAQAEARRMEQTEALAAAAPALLATLVTMRDRYGRLHDALSDCIEAGRLTAETLPDDYAALVELLAQAAQADDLAARLTESTT